MRCNAIHKKIIFLILILSLCPFIASAESETFDSYAIAVYEKIIDSDTSNIDIFHTAMSADGNVIFFNGLDVQTDGMIVGHINSDGSGLKTYPAPDDSAMNLVTNGDGSIAYFNSLNAVHKIEDGSIDEVVAFDEEYYIWALQTDKKGEYVYMTVESIGNIWKINYDATQDFMVVDRTEVEVDEKNVSKILDFRIADDGIKVGFLSQGYVKDEVSYELSEVFFSKYGNSNQVTFDDEENDEIVKVLFDMSGDGTDIIYGVQEDTYLLRPGTKYVARLGSFTGWGHLNYDGSIMFTSDDNDGVLVSTINKAVLDLSLNDNLEEDVGGVDGTLISNDGDTVSFIVMSEDYSSTSLYVGHFYSSTDDIPAASPNALYSAKVAYLGELHETPVPELISEKPVPVEDQESSVVFESRSKPTGTSVQIPLTMSGTDEAIGNMDLTLSYDPSVLECVELVKGGLTENSLFEYNIMTETVKVSLVDMKGFSGDGSICYVKFNVIGEEGESSPLRIDKLIANSASDLAEIDIDEKDGTFTILGVNEGKGDAAGDGGEYSAYDALYALLMSVDKIEMHDSMDINDDGSVSSIDARLILKMASEKKPVN